VYKTTSVERYFSVCVLQKTKIKIMLIWKGIVLSKNFNFWVNNPFNRYSVGQQQKIWGNTASLLKVLKNIVLLSQPRKES